MNQEVVYDEGRHKAALEFFRYEMSRAKPSINDGIKAIVKRGSKVLIAVSAGLDSIALLHAVCKIQSELQLHIEVAHVDHSVRTDSAIDADFVNALAKENSLTSHIRVLDPQKCSGNFEAWAREQRYLFFAQVLRERSLDWVLTAHHADDVAETLLMRLISNKEPRSILRIDHARKCLRPLLSISRADLESYVKLHNLNFHEDSTNQDDTFLRNKIRIHLIPHLRQKFEPRISEVLSRRAEAMASDLEALESMASTISQRLHEREFGSKLWLRHLVDELNAAPPALQWRVCSQLFSSRLQFKLGREHSEGIVEFILGKAEGLELPTGLQLRRSSGGVLVVPTSPQMGNIS